MTIAHFVFIAAIVIMFFMGEVSLRFANKNDKSDDLFLVDSSTINDKRNLQKST